MRTIIKDIRLFQELKDCPECGKSRIAFGWYKDGETRKFSLLEIDKLIRHTQLNALKLTFEKFEMVKYISSGGFCSVYSALWMEGPKRNWDKWTRAGPTSIVFITS
ncbi:unnamed protein product [Rhizophagus irregularis]|nr:unnamed protein product [Rhizophagus irregularis]